MYIKSILRLIWVYITGGIFFTYRIYEKYSTNNNGVLRCVSKSGFSIVIQGPVIVDNSFTLKTIEIYRYNFPDAIIILSTWSVSRALMDELEKYNVHVVKNQFPENAGISNINLQITTSKTGVLEARKLGAQYVLKTRSDQRIYHPSFDAYLLNLIKSFPLSINKAGQTKRLVGISLDTLKYRLYGVSDMFLYGHVDDMVRYWNVSLDSRKEIDGKHDNSYMTWRTFSSMRVGQVYLCSEYLKKIGCKLDWTLRDSFQVLRDRFVIIDQSAIKLYWYKYTLNEDRYAQFGLFDPELSFNDWLMLYQSIENVIINENMIDQRVIRMEK